jgi:MFS family permease
LKRNQLFALSLYHGFNDGSIALFFAVLPIIRVVFDLSLIQIGTVLSAGLLSTVAMQFVFGYLSDKGYARSILVGGLVSLALLDIAFSQAGDYWHIFLVYLVFRAAAGVYHPVGFSMIFKVTQNRASAMGFQSAFGDLSLAFAMFSTGFIAERLGWQVPFLAWGIAGVICVFVFVSLAGFHGADFKQVGPAEDLKPIQNKGITRGYVVLQFSTVFVESLYAVFIGFIPLFLNINLELSLGLSTLVVALWLAVGVASSFNAGRFVEFFKGEHRTLTISFGMTAVMLTFATVFALKPELWIATVAMLILCGIPFFLSLPVLQGVVGTTAPRHRLGLAYAINLSLSLLAASAVSYGAGYLASVYTLVIILPLMLVTAIAASLTLFLI